MASARPINTQHVSMGRHVSAVEVFFTSSDPHLSAHASTAQPSALCMRTPVTCVRSPRPFITATALIPCWSSVPGCGQYLCIETSDHACHAHTQSFEEAPCIMCVNHTNNVLSCVYMQIAIYLRRGVYTKSQCPLCWYVSKSAPWL